MLNTEILLSQNNVPQEWLHYIDEAREHLNNHYCQWGNPKSINYIAIGDIHVGYKDEDFDMLRHLQKQANLIAAICQAVKIDFVVVLGDIVQDNDTAEKRKERMQNVHKSLSIIPVPVLYLPGNHDLRPYPEATTDTTNWDKEFFYQFINPIKNATILRRKNGNSDGYYNNYYYYDFDNLKLRCICFPITKDMNYGSVNEFWNDALINIPAGYKIIIFNHGNFCHKSLIYHDENTGNIQNDWLIGNRKILEELGCIKTEENEQKRENQIPKVLAIHTGHVHNFGLQITSEIPYIDSNGTKETEDDTQKIYSIGSQNTWSITSNSSNPLVRHDDPSYGSIGNSGFFPSEEEKWDGTIPCFDIVSLIDLRGEDTATPKTILTPNIDIYHVGLKPAPTTIHTIAPKADTTSGNKWESSRSFKITPGKALSPDYILSKLYPNTPKEKLDEVKKICRAKNMQTADLSVWWQEGAYNWTTKQYWRDYVTYPLKESGTIYLIKKEDS